MKNIDYCKVANRQSGRTSRMFGEALSVAATGVPVTIAVASRADYTHLKAEIQKRAQCYKYEIRVIQYDRLDGEEGIDWETCSIKWPKRFDDRLFIDHHAYAEKFHGIICNFHKYDANIPVHRISIEG